MFVFSSRRRHTRLQGDWSSDVCSSDLGRRAIEPQLRLVRRVGGDLNVGPQRPRGRRSPVHAPVPHRRQEVPRREDGPRGRDRKSTRLNSSHLVISYAVFCLKKKTKLLPRNRHTQTLLRRDHPTLAAAALGQGPCQSLTTSSASRRRQRTLRHTTAPPDRVCTLYH